MCKSEKAPQADQVGVGKAFILVAWKSTPNTTNGPAIWETEFFDDIVIARGFAEAQYLHGISEVRLMYACMEAKWGPVDPGGLFNREPRRKRDSNVPGKGTAEQP